MHLKGMRQGFTLIVSILVFSLLLPAQTEAEDPYSALRQRFQELYSSETLDESRLGELETLATNFLDHSRCEECGRRDEALLFAARLHLKKFSALSDNASIITALRLYQQIEEDFPTSEFIDEIIVEKGDAFLLLGERERARTQYTKLILEHGSSRLMRLAQDKLLALEPFAEDPEFLKSLADMPEIRASVRLPRKRKLIVLDPGHGGEDAGAQGLHNLVEKDIVLDIATRLKRRLEGEGYQVELTREDDTFIPLGERTALANELGASLFVSLHVNASPKGNLSGYQTFYLDNTDDAASKRLAERENRFSQGSGSYDDIGFIVSDLIQNGKLKDSIILANLIHRYVLTSVGQDWTNIRDLGIRKGPFFVLVGAHMPCVLSELFFIDNHQDSARLNTEEFREDLVNGLFLGIASYLDRKQDSSESAS